MKNFRSLFVLLLPILFGCNQRYTYIQYGKTFDGKVLPNKREVINAKSDLEAYKKSMLKFGGRLMASKEMVSQITDSSQLRTYTPFPYCYTLLTPDGEKVSNVIDKQSRIVAQKEALKLLQKAAKHAQFSVREEEIVDRDLIK